MKLPNLKVLYWSISKLSSYEIATRLNVTSLFRRSEHNQSINGRASSLLVTIQNICRLPKSKKNKFFPCNASRYSIRI